MELDDKSKKRAGPAPATRPLGALHKDHGWTPEGLQAEIEAKGLDYDEEVAKQRRMVAEMAERHLNGRKAFDAESVGAPAPALGDVPAKR